MGGKPGRSGAPKRNKNAVKHAHWSRLSSLIRGKSDRRLRAHKTIELLVSDWSKDCNRELSSPELTVLRNAAVLQLFLMEPLVDELIKRKRQVAGPDGKVDTLVAITEKLACTIRDSIFRSGVQQPQWKTKTPSLAEIFSQLDNQNEDSNQTQEEQES